MREHRWTHARLSEYLDGGLREPDRLRVEHHVHRCPECRRVLAALRRTIAELMLLRAVPQRSVAPGAIERLRREG
jgi:anti-sigma factor RsiW